MSAKKKRRVKNELSLREVDRTWVTEKDRHAFVMLNQETKNLKSFKKRENFS